MYGKSGLSGVESMNRANDDIRQRTAVDILNATLILLKKESNRYEKAQDQAWNHSQQLTPRGVDLMEEAFKKVNTAMFKIHVMEVEDHHAVLVSKNSTSKREYTVIIPKADIMGSRLEPVCCDHMVAISKLGRINGLSRIVIMPHWYTTEQWCNQFPEDTFINTCNTLELIKAKLNSKG
jgi:hypothetical protein